MEACEHARISGGLALLRSTSAHARMQLNTHVLGHHLQTNVHARSLTMTRRKKQANENRIKEKKFKADKKKERRGKIEW